MALSDEHKLRVMNIAGMKLITLVAENHQIAEMAREFPEELSQIFLAGVQAGAEAMASVLKDTLTS